MSCANNDINIELKDLTKKSLDFIYDYATKKGDIATSNIYKSTTDINNPFSQDFKTTYGNEIQTDLNSENEEGKTYLTTNLDNNFFMNCAIQTSVPWFSSSQNRKTCDVVNNIEYDETRIAINKVKDKTVITPVLNSKSKKGFCAYYSNINKSYCENRWYDWITIPNYYLGNTYYKDNSHYTELDVYKCYSPCPGDYLPYTKENGDMKCIPKKFFGNGIFNKKYMYNSLGLINLIGNLACSDDDKKKFNTNLLYILHRLIYEHNIETKVDNNIYSAESNIANLMTLKSDSTSRDKSFDKIKPEYDGIYRELYNTVNEHILKNFDGSKNKDYNIINEFTYANYKFNENEPDMYSFTGMEANGLLTDPILIHTWMLAQIFQPLNIEKVFGYTNSQFGATEPEQKTKIEQFQNEYIYKKLYNIYNNEFTKAHPEFLERVKSGEMFKGIEDKIKNEANNSKHIAIRLKNIFFKAINNCYNNKTNFSVNLISRTKKALQNGNLISIIKDENNRFYNSSNNIIFNLPDVNSANILIPITMSTIPTIEQTYETLLSFDINNIEHTYYKDTDIKKLYDNYKKVIDDTVPATTKKHIGNYFDENNNYCHYLFSMEELETPTCPPGYVYNTTDNQCQLAPRKPIKTEIKTEDDDSDFKIPNLRNIFIIFVQILMVILILYILYVIHDIFGEIIKKGLNYIYVNFIKGFYNLIYISAVSGNTESEKERNRINKQLKILDADLKTIITKKDTIKEYMER